MSVRAEEALKRIHRPFTTGTRHWACAQGEAIGEEADTVPGTAVEGGVGSFGAEE